MHAWQVRGASQQCYPKSWRQRTAHAPCKGKQRARAVHAAAVQWDAPPVVVVGAGIAGTATALALHKVGIPVVVLEESSQGVRAGEGSAIGLWENAWVAMDALGIGNKLRPLALRLDRIDLCRSDGMLLRSFGFAETTAGQLFPRSSATLMQGGDGPPLNPSTLAGCEFRGLWRRDLVNTLASELPPGTIRSGAAVRTIEISTTQWPVVVTADGQRIEAGIVVGADGVRSDVAQYLGLGQTKYSGYTTYRGVATLPEGLSAVGLKANTIRQVWGSGVRAGLYPLSSQHVYWFTCFNAPQDEPVPPTPEALQADALARVSDWEWGVRDLIRCTDPVTISRSRIGDRWTPGAFGKGLVTLAGDAAHPMTPNLGQGGCTALEDAVVLGRTLATCLSAHGRVVPREVQAALRAYEAERSARCLPLAVRSYVIGALLQLPFAPVLAVRDIVIRRLFNPSHFLDHTTYNCGRLPTGVVKDTSAVPSAAQ